MGCLRDASLEHGKDFGLVDGPLEVEEAGGGRSPLASEEVQGRLHALAVSLACVGAEVLALPVLPVGLAPWHVGPHVEGEDVAAGEAGQVELLLVAESVPLVPEEVQEAGEAGVILGRMSYRFENVTAGG